MDLCDSCTGHIPKQCARTVLYASSREALALRFTVSSARDNSFSGDVSLQVIDQQWSEEAFVIELSSVLGKREAFSRRLVICEVCARKICRSLV